MWCPKDLRILQRPRGGGRHEAVSDYYHIRTVDVSRGLGVFGEEVATALDPAVPHDADGVHDQVAATIRLPCGLVRG